jgi:exosortase/archaeosortase family protein
MSSRAQPPQTLRTVVAVGVIAGLVHLAQAPDALRDFTRPIVISILRVLGFTVEDRGEMMSVGHLEVPWTRDCAGVNLLLILLALAIWVNREEKLSFRLALRIGFMVPAALAANVARVLTLISWRTVFYPAVESPQTHYFLGLVWLVPFVSLITPKSTRPRAHGFMETLHAAAVVALLAPMSGSPNGALITLAAVLSLAQCSLRTDHLRMRTALTLVWLIGGIGIAVINMDSFWLPWMLTCPLLLAADSIKSPARWVVIACTHSVLVMQSWALPLGIMGIALVLGSWLKGNSMSPSSDASQGVGFGQSAIRSLCLVFFALPFVASTFLSVDPVKWSPPSSVRSRPMGSEGLELILPGQSSEMGLLCYSSPGRDRHHSIKVCLNYRGIDITSVDDESPVMTDGKHWLREFFLQDGNLLADYGSYLRRTFRPWASPGQHLIFITPRENFSPADFERQCTRLAESLHHLCIPTPQPLAINP